MSPSQPGTHQSGLSTYFLFCSRFNITATPASPLALQYFCVDKSQLVSYKMLRVSLSAIHLMHIENGFPDPTTYESLHLVCIEEFAINRAVLTINLLQTLKSQLCSSKESLLNQCLLWAAFTPSFYGFLRASECLSLTWSDVIIHNDHVTIIYIMAIKNRSLQKGTINPGVLLFDNQLSSTSSKQLW